MMLKDTYAQTVLDNFAGKTTTWREIKQRCGFSDNEVSIALSALRQRGMLAGNGQYGEPVEVLSPNAESS